MNDFRVHMPREYVARPGVGPRTFNTYMLGPAADRGGANGDITILAGGSMTTATAKFAIQQISPGRLLITCNGGLSWEDRDVLAAGVEQHLPPARPVSGVVMDMAAVEYVNSAGLGALFQLLNVVKHRGGKVAFANVAPRLLSLFRTVGLDRSSEVCDTVEQAVGGFSANPAAGRTDGM